MKTLAIPFRPLLAVALVAAVLSGCVQTRQPPPPRPMQPPPPPYMLVPNLDRVQIRTATMAEANVRSGPSTDAGVLTRLPRGENLVAVGRVRGTGWYLVENGGRGLGYMHASVLTLSGGKKPAASASKDQQRPTAQPEKDDDSGWETPPTNSWAPPPDAPAPAPAG